MYVNLFVYLYSQSNEIRSTEYPPPASKKARSIKFLNTLRRFRKLKQLKLVITRVMIIKRQPKLFIKTHNILDNVFFLFHI